VIKHRPVLDELIQIDRRGRCHDPIIDLTSPPPQAQAPC